MELAVAVVRHTLAFAGLLGFTAPEGLTVNEIHSLSGIAMQRLKTGDVQYDYFYGELSADGTSVDWKGPLHRDHVLYDISNGYYINMERWTPAESTMIKGDVPLVRRHSTGGSMERVISTPDRILEYHPDPLSDGTRLAITDDLPENSPVWNRCIPYPWLFGVVPEVIDDLHDHSFDSLTSAAADGITQPVREDLNGRSCWKVIYRRDDGRSVAIWYAPECNMSIRQVVMEGSHQYGSWRSTLSLQLKAYPVGETWYPAEALLRSEMVDSSEPDEPTFRLIRVSDAKFGFPINPDRFTVKGLSPATGTAVAHNYDAEIPIEEWDGSTLVPYRPIPDPEIVRTLEPRRRGMKWYILVGANALLIATAIFWWGFMRKKHS